MRIIKYTIAKLAARPFLSLKKVNSLSKDFHVGIIISSSVPKAQKGAYRLDCRLSSFILRRLHSLNIFSLETSWLIETQFRMEPPWDEGKKFVQIVHVTFGSLSLYTITGKPVNFFQNLS